MRLLTEEMEHAFRMDAPLVAGGQGGAQPGTMRNKWKMENGELMCGAQHG